MYNYKQTNNRKLKFAIKKKIYIEIVPSNTIRIIHEPNYEFKLKFKNEFWYFKYIVYNKHN